MILSKRHRYIFIKGVKVAGTSIEVALSPSCGPDDIVTPITPIDELSRLQTDSACRNFADDPEGERAYLDRIRRADPDDIGNIPLPKEKYYNHISLREVVHHYGKSLQGFRILYAVRSPYSRVISWINMRLSYAAYVHGGAMIGEPLALQRELDRTFTNGMIQTIRNIERYRWPDGSLHGLTMRYENLHEDFASVAAAIGLKTVPALPHLKKGVMADSLDPLEVFRPDQIEAINRIFADEFSAFDYRILR